MNDLKESKRWMNTEFVLTTNYRFKSQRPFIETQGNIWILSTEKIRYAGNESQIVPTIYRLVRHPVAPSSLSLNKPLIY